MSTTILGKWLSISLSVLLTVVLFWSIGGGYIWGSIYGAVGLVLSMAQFTLPSRIREQHQTGNHAALLALVILFFALQAVSLLASIGSLSASLDNIKTESQLHSQQRVLLLRQIQQEQDRVDIWNSYERPSDANNAQTTITALREELANLPVYENTNALAMVDTLSGLTGVSSKAVAGSVYLVLSILLDACAVYFILTDQARSKTTFSLSKPVTLPQPSQPQEEPQEQTETIVLDTPYKAIIEGTCRLSVRSIRNHYGVGTSKAYQILEQLLTAGLIEKDDKTNRYTLTHAAKGQLTIQN